MEQNTSSPAASALKGPFELLHEAWRAYVSRFTVFLWITLITFGLALILGLLFVLFIGVFLAWHYLGAIAFLLLALFAGVVQLWNYTAMVYAAGADSNLRLKDIYSASWRKITSLLWIGILSSLVAIGGLILLVVPGIIAGIMMSLGIFIFMRENKRGMEALLISREYVRNRWWAVFGRWLFMGVVMIIFSVLLSLIPFVGPLIILAVLVPLHYIYGFVLYDDLKAAKSGVSAADTKTRGAFMALGTFGLVAVIAIPALLVSLAGLGRFGAFNKNPSAHQSWPSSYVRVIARGADAIRINDLRQIQTALSIYRTFQPQNVYPQSLTELSSKYPAIKLADPAGKNYNYCTDSARAHYIIQTQLDNSIPVQRFNPGLTSDTSLCRPKPVWTCDPGKNEYCLESTSSFWGSQ